MNWLAFITVGQTAARKQAQVQKVVVKLACLMLLLQPLTCVANLAHSNSGGNGDSTPRFHRDCGPGRLLVTGICQPIESALAASGGKVYWVAQQNLAASDDNAGTREQPWKTISRAVKELQPGDAVIVRTGVYRESIHPIRGGTDAEHRITYVAYTGDKVAISGADILSDGWTQDDKAWRHAWTVDLTAYGEGVFRREMIIVDGKVLRPVFSHDQLVPGTFFVEGPDYAPRAIYVRLPRDAAPTGHIIEAAQRHPLFGPADGTGWFRVIGFSFRHAANRGQWGALSPGREGSLIEENTVEWTNGKGIAADGRNHVFRANRTNDNGQTGIGGECTDCLLEYNQSLRNNWKGYDPLWEGGGGKFAKTSNTTIRFHEAGDNNGPGIWFDGDNHNNVIEQSIAYRNLAAGIMLELNTTKTIVRNNVLYRNRRHDWTGTGLLSQAASHNIVVHNTFISNEGSGLWIHLDTRAPNGSNQIFNNLFGHNTRQTREGYEICIEGSDLANARSNQLDGNLYWHPGSRYSNQTFYFQPDSSRPDNFRSDDIAGWRKLTGGDANARIADPLLSNISRLDGWRLTARSPAISMGVKPPVNVLSDLDGQARPLMGADVGADQWENPL